jgi:hypothetical protein
MHRLFCAVVVVSPTRSRVRLCCCAVLKERLLRANASKALVLDSLGTLGEDTPVVIHKGAAHA